MNTNTLKKFAQEARKKLLSQIGSKLTYVLNADSAELRSKATQIQSLKDAIAASSEATLIDQVAYTWFNRFMALRFMDVNDYQPLGIRVVSPKDGFTLPEILQEAKQGILPAEFTEAGKSLINAQHVQDLLDGKVLSNNPQNDAYKELLIAACNHLHRVFPFLFERLEDYSELLLPDDLTSPMSILQDIRQGMSEEDCKEVEVIGWLYQFYISEKNEELIASKKVYKKEDLAPASQLFTPKWIVQYMVDNTLGQVWAEINPNTLITQNLEYYIKPAYSIEVQKRVKKSIEEVKFFEPCTGSGHILAYAFDVFYKIYEEEGYNPTEIPELIISKNLFGVDIDPRAAQLASFVLIMKGRQKNRRFLRNVEINNIQPNISYYQNFAFDEKFKNATALGSLIRVETSDLENFTIDENSLFSERHKELGKLYKLLGQRYDVVVTNPPYISSSRMEASLKQYVEATYQETKSDLFATFILRCLELCNEDGLTGFMTPFVWMFISSYEKLREIIIDKHFINNLIQLEYSGFDGATVPICTFTLRNKNIDGAKGSYIRLSDFRGSQNQAPKTLEAINNLNCGWFFTTNQKDFKKIPGSPIGYWLSKNEISAFENKSLDVVLDIKSGLLSGNDEYFLKKWFEISFEHDWFNINSYEKFLEIEPNWTPVSGGGDFRKWFGNLTSVVNSKNDFFLIKNTKDINYRLRSSKFYFKESVNWPMISSTNYGAKYVPNKVIMGNGVRTGFINDSSNVSIEYFISYLSSKVVKNFLSIINPTLNFNNENIAIVPFKGVENNVIDKLGKHCIEISKQEWNSRETSWDFQANNFFRINNKSDIDLEETYDLYQAYWSKKFFELHANEEELNRQFIELYGLQDELTPDVPLEDITILKEETSIQNGQLVFKASEVFAQFMSYAVGCMFGRYSLDKEGLILANQGETLEDYLTKIERSRNQVAFLPDEDNIIPVLDDEWFEDDIVGRFYAFLKASFGTQNFEKNRAFVEECLGKDIRRYFVKDFYADHIKRYKKRPIYWMFSSPKGSFNVLVYMHRYTPDTLNRILNGYLVEYRAKLNNHIEQLDHLTVTGSSVEQTRADKEKSRVKLVLLELQEYERSVLYPLATERIAIDLDDGVLVNYNKFGKAIKDVSGLNDPATKKKVKEFDWIDNSQIR